MGLLEGRVAMVVGGARGVGNAVATLYAAEGARVVIVDSGAAPDGSGADPAVAPHAAEALCDRHGDLRALGLALDIGEADAAEQAVAATAERFQRLDVLVNSAGIASEQLLSRSTAEARARVYAVHAEGTFRSLQAATRLMRDRGEGGAVINTVSAAGLVGSYGQLAAGMADAAVYGLTRTASIELQRHGIRVNAVCPLAKTRLTEHLPLFEKATTLTAEQVAPLYLFLASDLGKHVSGQVLSAAGGRLSVFRMLESAGAYEEAKGGWTAASIAERWAELARG